MPSHITKEKTLHRKVKSSLTLLEVSIAILLTGILLSGLWQIYHNWYTNYQKTQILQSKSHKLIFLKQRLDGIFFLVSTSGQDNALFTPKDTTNGHATICFSYKGAPDPEIDFNGMLTSLLYIDNLNQLCFTTWANETLSRSEVLYTGVSSFEIEFFDHKTNSWQGTWAENIDHLPLFIKFHIKNNEGSESLIFRGQHPEEAILYLTTPKGSL